MAQRISIIGAGIAGLTAALALKQKGCEVTIYESASEIKPVGAGIVMASNAMQIFKKLGIDQKIAFAGNKISSMTIADKKMNPISIIELSQFEKKYGVYNVAIHRGELQKILIEEVGFQNIRLSKRLSKVEQNGDIELFFDDNTVERCYTLLAADGIKSVVRNQLFGSSKIRDVKQLCWRGITNIHLPEQYQHDAVELWGKGKRFGFVKIAPQKVYWFAVANEGLVDAYGLNLSNLFHEFHQDIHEIITKAPKENIIFNRLTDLNPIMKWYQKNVCLIGDAAHATTPNLGQGACQAVEDAYTLGQLYASEKSMESIFKEYESMRIEKAHTIVRRSWTLGKVAHIENELGIWFRNKLMRSLPKRFNVKQLESLFDVEYIL